MNQKRWKRIWKARPYYLLLLPALIYVIIFNYAPLYGIQIAFKDYRTAKGILGSRWVGFRNFKDFFSSFYFWRLLRNTLSISVYSLIVGFPIPILLALIINELRGKFKKFTQTILYAPHFISTVVLIGMIATMFSPSMGIVNTVLEALGLERHYFLADPKAFRHLYVWSGVWQNMGWSSIIYISALSSIDQELYEAASVDGASRWKQTIHITLPGILPTVSILLILQIGQMLSVGFEKVMLLYNPSIYETADIISTYVYRQGILGANYSYSAAVGLFNSVVNFILLVTVNTVSKKLSGNGLF